MASLENRSVSNLIEVMADERWERLVEQQGVAYAKTVAVAMNLKIDADNPADREKLRRAILDLVAGSKMRKQNGVVDDYVNSWLPRLMSQVCASPPGNPRSADVWQNVRPLLVRGSR